MKIKIYISFLFVILFQNCTGINIMSIYGFQNTNPTPSYNNIIQMEYKGGLLYHNDTVGGQLGNNAGSKLVGEACQISMFYLVSWGDSSIQAAKKAGKIIKVGSVEYEQTGVLGILYHSFCTKVTGDGTGVTSSSDPKIEAAIIPDTKDAKAVKLPAKKGK